MGAAEVPATSNSPSRFKFGDLTMDVAQRRVWRGGEQLQLSKLSFRLLRLLVERAPAVVTHDECVDVVWGPKRVVSPENLSQSVARLRRAIGDSSADPSYVESVRGEGYRLIPAVEAVSVDPASGSQRSNAGRTASLRYLITFSVILISVVVLLYVKGKDSERAAPRVLPQTVDGGLKQNVQLSPDGEFLVFDWAGPRGGNRDIYVRAVGPNSRSLRITEGPAPEFGPVWSPDGRELAFLRAGRGSASIFITPAFGGRERKVVDVEGPVRFAQRFVPSLSWAPDGRHLAYAERAREAEPSNIVIVDVETLQKTPLTAPTGGIVAIGDLEPAFAPDGQQIAFVRGTSVWSDLDIWIANRDGSRARQVTFERWAYCSDLVWTGENTLLVTAGNLFTRRTFEVDLDEGVPRPVRGLGENDRAGGIAGNRLAFVATSLEPPSIWRVPGRFAGDEMTEPQDLLIDGADKAYSPDGDQIAFQSQRFGRAQIWIADRDGNNATQVTDVRTAALRPRWTPDARTVIFESYDNGNADVFALDIATTRVRALTSRDSDDQNATVSRDGQWLYFSTNRTGRFELFRKRIDGGEAEQLTTEGGIYGIESYDGSHLYFVREYFDVSLWRIHLATGREELVFDEMTLATGLSWDLAPNGIYYELLEEDIYTIRYRDFESVQTTIIYEETGTADRYWIEVSPREDSVLFSKQRVTESELYVLEDFR